jgi:hypothetical protein
VRVRTAEEIANGQTVEQLALRIWAAIVAEKALSGMSALMDELLESHLLKDDDEEGDDEGWLDDTKTARTNYSMKPSKTGSTSIPTSIFPFLRGITPGHFQNPSKEEQSGGF